MSKGGDRSNPRCARIASAVMLLPIAGLAQPVPLQWSTVANTATPMPGSGVAFNSFNQPSVNATGWVVMRARGKGAQGAGEPPRGIYARQMGNAPGPLTVIFDTSTAVPGPNNGGTGGAPVTFTEFPAFARVGMQDDTVATRGQSNPLWVYTLPDGTETRVGTSGVYALRNGAGLSVAGQFGAVPDLSYYGVPGAPAGTRFDQFPGAPAVGGQGRIAFKGNWTEGSTSKTGVFVRQAKARQPQAPTLRIASSDTLIPGQPDGGVRFGSTAPPSAAGGQLVFLGVDNEDAPTLGGLYLAPMRDLPGLTPLVEIGQPVPGEPTRQPFARLGEALSFDGRYVAFWGSWGTETRSLLLLCPTDGNADLIAYCNAQYPDGYLAEVPLHQGFFVHDLRTGRTLQAASTGAQHEDFLYWTYSGRPPGTGGGDGDDAEPPRWRSAAFAAVQAGARGADLVFKARAPGSPVVDGIFLATVSPRQLAETPLLQTGDGATAVDPMAPAGASIVTLGIERDSLRNGWLAINASMLDAVTGEAWAGVYVARTR